MKLLREKLNRLDELENLKKRLNKSLDSFEQRAESGKDSTFSGDFFCWDKTGNVKTVFKINEVFTDIEIAEAIERRSSQVSSDIQNIKPVFEMAERALSN